MSKKSRTYALKSGPISFAHSGDSAESSRHSPYSRITEEEEEDGEETEGSLRKEVVKEGMEASGSQASDRLGFKFHLVLSGES